MCMKKLYFSLLFILCCVQAAVSDVLNEGFEAGTMPAGWTQEYVRTPITLNVDTAAFSWTVEKSDSLKYPVGAAEGTGRIAARNTSSDEMRFVTRLITPVMNVQNLFQPQVVFSHAEPAMAGYSDTLRIYYRTSQNDIWHPIANAVYARNATWKTEVLGLVAPTTTYQLAFEITENMGRGVVLDNIQVRATPTCRDVTDVHGINIHAFDATAVWSEEGYYDHFDVLCTKAPVTDPDNAPDSLIVVRNTQVYNTELVLENLQAETTYYLYVRSDCQENASGFTDWASGQLTTLSVAYLPYQQDFNTKVNLEQGLYFGLPLGWQTGSSVEGQTIPYIYSGGSKNERAGYSVDSTAFFAFSAETSAAGVNKPLDGDVFAYAATPEVMTEDMSSVQVSLWATVNDKMSVGTAEYAAELLVGVMTDPLDFNTFVVVDTLRLDAAYQFKRFDVSLASYQGAGKFVALASYFHKRNAIYVDNFSLTVPATHVPSGVAVKNAHSKGFAVLADKGSADSWNVVVSSEYAADGNVNPASILYRQSGLTQASHQVVVADGSLAGQIVRVYTQAVKNGQESAWSFPVTIRVPMVMTVPYSNGCEVGSGLQQLNLLGAEMRASQSLQGMASVLYPLAGISSDVKSHPVLESTAPNYNGAHARFEGVDSWFCLPEVENLSNLKMVFRYASLSKGRIEVGVMTDPYDLSTFEHVASFSSTESSYRRGLVSFDAYRGTGKFIAFRSVNANEAIIGSNMLLDQIIVDELGDCREASNVESLAEANSVEITWNGGGMDSWIVSLSKVRQMMNAQTKTVTSPSCVFDELDPETTYYFTIQTVCGDSLLDLDQVYYEFHTPRGLPYREPFTSSAWPSDWTRSSASLNSVLNGGSHVSTTSGWAITNSASYVFAPQKGNAAFMDLWSTNQYWMISPALEISEAVGAMELTFDLAIHGFNGWASAGSDDVFGVLVSLDGGNTWSRDNAFLWTNDGQGDFVLDDLNWETSQSIALNFTPFIGHNIKFAFFGGSTISGNGDSYFSVDNIDLHVSDAHCGGISNLRVVAAGDNAISATWMINGVEPYPAQVQVSTSSNFTTLLVDDTTTVGMLSLTDLEASTRYYVRVRQLCPSGSDWVVGSAATPCSSVTLEQFGTESFTEAAVLDCWTVGFALENGTGDLPQRVDDAQFGKVLRITKNAVGETASDGAYAISPQFNIPDSLNHYQVVFRAGAYSDEKTNVGRIKVGVVTDPTDAVNTFEPAAELRLAKATDSLTLKTYVVSLADYIGDYNDEYGRYIMFLSETGSDSTNYVYIDDVSVEPAQACRQVLNLEADTTTEDAAHLIWSGEGAEYELMVTTSFARADTVSKAFLRTIVDGGDYWVNGLDANKTYFAYIRTICGADTARWSSPTAFTTRFGIFFEPWDDKTNFAAAGWTQGNYEMTGTAPFAGSNISASSYAWSIVDDPSTAYTTVTGMYGKSARSNVYSTGSSGNKWLISPSIDLTHVDGGAMLSFSFAAYPYGQGVGPASSTDKSMYVLVSGDNGQTWDPSKATVWACNNSADYDFRTLSAQARRFSIDISEYVGKRVKVAFYGKSTGTSSDLYYAFDSIGVSKFTAECLGVRNLELNMISATDMKATWRNISIPEEVKVELATDAAFQNVLYVDTLTSVSERIYTNLLPNRTYYVRAQQLCSGAKAVVASIATPKAIPFEENFASSTLPAGWEVLRGNVQDAFDGTLPVANASSAWKMVTGSSVLAPSHLVGEMYNLATQTDYWLVSPDIILNDSSMDDINLIFDLALTTHNGTTAPAAATATDGNEFRVLISSDGGASWSEEYAWLFKNTTGAYMPLSDLSAEGQRIMLDVSDFRGERIRVAFYKASAADTENDNDIHIANVKVRVVGEPCATPTELTVDSTSFTVAHLAWTSENAEAQTVIYTATLNDFSNARVDTAVAVSDYLITGLAPATTYYVRVKSLCGENSESEYSETVSFSTSIGLPYNEALVARGNWLAFTETASTPLTSPTLATPSTNAAGWRAGTEAKILGGNHMSCAHNTSTFWLVSPEIDLTPNTTEMVIGMSVDLALTSGYSNAAAPSATAVKNKHFYIMISTDNGLTWNESNRWEWSADADANYSLAAIPAGLGDTYELDITRFGGQKIRVALVLEGATKASLAMHAANFQIYALKSNCFGVSNITVNKVDTAATVTLTPKDAATQWEVAYGYAGKDVTEMQTKWTDNTTVLLTGLNLNKQYDVYARSICAEGDTSVWFGPVSFATPLGITYLAPFDNTFSSWTRMVGDPAAVFAGTASPSTSATGWTTTSGTAALGEQHIYAKTGTVAAWLVSPVINLMPQAGTDKTIYLTMDMALTASTTGSTAPLSTAGSKFYVAVSEDEGQTWAPAHVFGDSTTYRYADIPAGLGRAYHLNMTAYAGKAIRMALILDASAATSVLHVNDLELAEYAIPCFGAVGLTASYAKGLTTCVITPDVENVAQAWQYVYGAQGFTPSSANAVTVSDTLFTIADLPMATTTDIYVRSICSASDTSSWYGPVQVKTPFGVRYEELMAWTTMNADWSELSYNTTTGKFVTPTTNYWYAGSTKNNYAFGVNHAYINASSSRKSMLVSPEIDLSNCVGKSVQLSFDMALTASSSSNAPTSTAGQSFELRVSTDNGKNWGTAITVWGNGNTADYLYGDVPTTGETYMVDLSDFAGENVKLGFYSVSTGNCSNDVHIRNVVVDTIVGTFCSPVRRISLVDSTLNTLTIAIRAQGIQDVLDVQYICQPEYNFFNERLLQHSDTNVITITGLQSSMAYDIYARTLCADSTLTPWAGPFTLHTAECTPVLGVASSNITLTDADIVLATRNENAAVGYQLYLTERGGVLDPTAAITSPNTHFAFSYPFQASMSYDVYARKICLVGDTSEWTGPFSVKAPIGEMGNLIYQETLEQTSMPSGWTHYTSTSTTIPTPSNAFSTSSASWAVGNLRNGEAFGVDHAYINIWSNYKRMFATPAIDLSAITTTGAVLVFDLALTDYDYSGAGGPPESTANQRFEIRVSPDGGNTWNMAEAWAESGAEYEYAKIPHGNGETYMVNLSEYVGEEIMVGFYACAIASGADNNLHVHNVRIYEAGDQVGGQTVCQGIATLDISNVQLNQADLTITYKDESARDAFVEVATDMAFDQVVIADSVHGNMIRLSNLLPSTTYYVRAKSLCGDGNESRYSATVKFATGKGIRYYEDFEDNTTFSTEWTRYSDAASTVFRSGKMSTTSNSGWSYINEAANGMPSAHAHMNIYSNNKYWLVSPEIDLTPNVGDAIVFGADVVVSKYKSSHTDIEPADPSGTDDQFIIAVSDDGGRTWSSANSYQWADSATTAQYQGKLYGGVFSTTPHRVVLDFTRFAGHKVKVAFYGESTVSNADNWLIVDNVELNTTESYTYRDTICSSSEYENYGFTYAPGAFTPGLHELNRMSAEMDSMVNLKLFVQESYEIHLYDTVCEGELYNRYDYNFIASTSGIQRRRLTASNGCDSLVMLHLFVNPILRENVELYACKGTSYTIAGKTFYNSGMVRDTLSSVVTGCDSIVTYYVNFSDKSSYHTSFRQVLCDGDTYTSGTATYTQPGVYREELASMGGCDSIVDIVLLSIDATGMAYDSIDVRDLPYMYAGYQLLSTSTQVGRYTKTVTTSCGSSVTLTVTVYEGMGLHDVEGTDRRIQKVVVDDMIYIIVDDRWYDATGRLVK